MIAISVLTYVHYRNCISTAYGQRHNLLMASECVSVGGEGNKASQRDLCQDADNRLDYVANIRVLRFQDSS